MSLSLQQRSDQLQTKIKRLLNSDLKEVCRSEGMPVSGVKAVLQNRIVDRLNDIVSSEDTSAFNKLFQSVNQFGTPLPDLTSSAHVQYNSTSSTSKPNNLNHQPQLNSHNPTMPNGYGNSHNGTSHGSSARPGAFANRAARLQFKRSPFYDMQDPITNAIEISVAASSRNTSSTSFQLNANMVERLRNENDLKIMLYCAQDPGNSPYPMDVSFPGQIELKVNGEVYPGNLRGIKKKPGTTRPADITSYVRSRQTGFANQLTMTYAAADKANYPSMSKFLYAVYLVKKRSVEELVQTVRQKNHIPKASVINEMRAKADDPDIVATSSVMSLKCPLSTMRMQLPCRGHTCHHSQCFDATSYLQTQEQAPQWSCPICNKTCKFDDLAVDEYVQDILARTKQSTESVTIEPNGEWREGTDDRDKKADFARPNGVRKNDTPVHEIHDLVELTDYKPNGHHRAESASTQFMTPDGSSRAPSAAASTMARSSKKRAAEEVIDLTLDDEDEDDEPRRPVKRQSTQPAQPHSFTHTHNAFPNFGSPSPIVSNNAPPHTNAKSPSGSGFSCTIPQHQQHHQPIQNGLGNYGFGYGYQRGP